MRAEIKIYLKKYCKIHKFKIDGVDIPMEYKTKDGRIVDNNKFIYVTQTWRNNHRPFSFSDKITKAYNYIIEHVCDCPEEEFYHKMKEID